MPRFTALRRSYMTEWMMDVKVTATGAIAQMYIRKQGIFTEKKIFPYAKLEDLRQDLLPKSQTYGAESCRR